MTPLRETHDDPALDAAMTALKLAEAQIHAPAHLEAAMMAAWDTRSERQRTKGKGTIPLFVGAAVLAASVVLAVTVALLQVNPVRQGTQATAPEQPVPLASSSGASRVNEAVSIPSAQTEAADPEIRVTRDVTPARRETAMLVLLGEPLTADETVRVVRMRVPGSTLAELGIRSASTPRAQSVELDVLVGEDGVARALRVGM